MVGKIKRIVYRFRHPLFWPKGFILGVIAAQVSLMLITILWIIHITTIPEKPYIEKTLDTRRELIKNLKLANIEEYAWRPVLNCENILRENHYKQHTLEKKEEENCIPMSLQFSKIKRRNKNKYIRNDSRNIIKYGEKVEKPCLICHKTQARSSVNWIYHVSKQTSRHLSGKKNDEIVQRSIIIAVGSIFIFWLIYSIIRLILYSMNKLNVLTLSFISEDQRFPQKPLEEMGFKKSNFLYAELGEYFLRGYISRSAFLQWLETLVKNKTLKSTSHLFSNIKGSVIRTNSHNNFEGMRISQIIARRAEVGRIIFEQAILSKPKIKVLDSNNNKKIVWKIRRNNYVKPKKYQFIDLKFESITDLVETKSLVKVERSSRDGQ